MWHASGSVTAIYAWSSGHPFLPGAVNSTQLWTVQTLPTLRWLLLPFELFFCSQYTPLSFHLLSELKPSVAFFAGNLAPPKDIPCPASSCPHLTYLKTRKEGKPPPGPPLLLQWFPSCRSIQTSLATLRPSATPWLRREATHPLLLSLFISWRCQLAGLRGFLHPLVNSVTFNIRAKAGLSALPFPLLNSFPSSSSATISHGHTWLYHFKSQYKPRGHPLPTAPLSRSPTLHCQHTFLILRHSIHLNHTSGTIAYGSSLCLHILISLAPIFQSLIITLLQMASTSSPPPFYVIFAGKTPTLVESNSPPHHIWISKLTLSRWTLWGGEEITQPGWQAAV